VIVAKATDFASWRAESRALLHAGVRPDDVDWNDGLQRSLFDEEQRPPTRGDATAIDTARVPQRFLESAEVACDHADPARFAVLYRLLWKITHGAHDVTDDPFDADAGRLATMVREVYAEEHDMHAFVRFRRAGAAGGGAQPNESAEQWIAWYAPAHRVLGRVAPFFMRRYPSMHWTLFTPDRSAHWDGHKLTFGPGAPRETAPEPDELDALFATSYASIINPARTNVALLRKHQPAQVRAQLPEAPLFEPMVRHAPVRVARMRAPRASASEALLPLARDLSSLAHAARSCRACPIGEHATQTVFGEGPPHAKLVIVGEQPGDEEDRVGRPFVGPAGRLLDKLLERAGVPRAEAYVTGAVKHFKWEPRGKRRIHSKPNREEIDACHGWLIAQIEAIKPRMILCLGATAAQSFCGPGFRVQRDRGKPRATPWAPWWMATYHPSALLRAKDEAKSEMEADILADLALVREQLASLAAQGRAGSESA
jgi:probable DNA metabolism protein